MDKIVTFGEIMLRLKPPGHERFFQSPLFEATFGGGEANVAALPDNERGSAALADLRRQGVDVSQVRKTAGRLGVYFLETG